MLYLAIINELIISNMVASSKQRMRKYGSKETRRGLTMVKLGRAIIPFTYFKVSSLLWRRAMCGARTYAIMRAGPTLMAKNNSTGLY